MADFLYYLPVKNYNRELLEKFGLESVFENHVREAITLDSTTAESLRSNVREAFEPYATRLG